MSFDTLFDGIFLVPFLNGLLLAVFVPVLGAYSRLRGELLASLGVTQVAAAGVGLAALLDMSTTAGALLAAAIAAGTKSSIGREGSNDAYAVMLLAGWGAGILLAANTARGDELARALLQGQIYFTGRPHLWGILLVTALAAVLMRWLSPKLLVGCLFPDHNVANDIDRRHDLVFDVLVAATLSLAAIVVGVMGAFALIVLPPWVAFLHARSWRSTVTVSVLVGLVAFGIAFVLAILLDQPFGPVLVVVLLGASLGRLLGAGSQP